jgi:hypothetical protein
MPPGKARDCTSENNTVAKNEALCLSAKHWTIVVVTAVMVMKNKLTQMHGRTKACGTCGFLTFQVILNAGHEKIMAVCLVHGCCGHGS